MEAVKGDGSKADDERMGMFKLLCMSYQRPYRSIIITYCSLSIDTCLLTLNLTDEKRRYA